VILHGVKAQKLENIYLVVKFGVLAFTSLQSSHDCGDPVAAGWVMIIVMMTNYSIKLCF
jgi:hypothetical protein